MDRLTCQQVEVRASDLLDGKIPPGEREPVERHLSACGSCTRFVQEIRQTVRRLNALPREPMPPGMKERLRQALHDRHTP